MFASAPFPTHLVSAPIGAVYYYAQEQTGTQTIDNAFNTVHFLNLYKMQNAVLLDLKIRIVRFAPHDAQAVIDDLHINPITLMQSIQGIAAIPIPTKVQEKRLLKEMKTLSNNLIDLINDLHFIANSGEIDENSLEYQSFLVELAHQAQQEGGAVWGKEALFALFD